MIYGAVLAYWMLLSMKIYIIINHQEYQTLNFSSLIEFNYLAEKLEHVIKDWVTIIEPIVLLDVNVLCWNYCEGSAV